MTNFNILTWCDEKITSLKANNIEFKNGIPQLPDSFTYPDRPESISTFRFRNDISDDMKKKSLLSFYMPEDNLWTRLTKIDEDIHIMKQYAGITGFDLSPSITMLRPRQLLSILINAIYSCYCGMHGVKVLPNYRPGDFGTLCRADYFPDNSPFIIGNLGCRKNGYKDYGEYQLDIILRKKRPNVLYVYGGLSKSEAKHLIEKYRFDIIKFSDRRNRVRNNCNNYIYYATDDGIKKDVYPDTSKGGVA